FSYSDEEGSTAQIAKLLQAPVLLILDVGKMARSAGALALGYCRFDPKLKIAGFILNRCGSESHYQGTKLAVEQATGLPVLGWLPKNADLHIPERHLGLVPGNERGELADFFGRVADVVEQHFDLDQILTIAQTESLSPPHLDEAEIQPYPLLSNEHHVPRTTYHVPRTIIAVARDTAFSFYYEDNLHILHEAGAKVVFFSPQQDLDIPKDTSGIYFGGGFPEIYAAQLTANRPLLAALRRAHAAGMPIYAECGGFMYLTEAIVDLAGQLHPMVGLIPGLSRMQPRLVSLGYRLVESSGNFLLPQGVITRGHEFHWSTWEIPLKDEGGRMKAEKPDPSSFILHPSSFTPAWRIRPRQGDGDGKPTGYAHNNLVASYVHLHFAHNFQLAHNFVQACRQWREAR
ncbi:MAG TPA: cobyrinate a,c-diamide synthase, partial [Anaerolineae bacterium]|nr:cobyrinate a,c-diamide synthase [Anaerolineae bacterium]